MADYWALRQAEAQEKRTATNIKDTEKQLKVYYTDAMHSAIRDFEETFLHWQARAEDGKVTPADLYKMDKYWATIAQLNFTMKELGDKQAQVLAENFMKEWQEVYESTAATSQSSFKTANTDIAEQMINSVWCADGKSWSERVWGNTEALKAALNEGLIECVVTGKKASDLKKRLQNEFGASYRQADMLVRTEMQHIQTEAARQRYEDDGITKYEFLGREETHGCSHSPSCHELDGQVFFMKDMKVGRNAPPIHPNCRCSIVPVVDLDEVKENTMEEEMDMCMYCGEDMPLSQLSNDVCPKCRREILASKEAKALFKKGATEESVLDSIVWAEFYEEEGIQHDKSTLFGEFMSDHHQFQRWKDADGKYHRAEKYPAALAELLKEYEEASYTVFRNPRITNKKRVARKIEKWLFKCLDCGKVFIKDNVKSNKQERCHECQEIHSKMLAAERQRKRRAKKK